jgi:uncharacterized OB-fold protein
MISPRYSREIPQRYRLEAAQCSKCGNVSFPPRLVCPDCKGKSFQRINLSEEGTLETFTIIRVAPEKFSKAVPYVVGVVRLEGGTAITTQLADVDPEEVQIGQKVRLVFRKIQEESRSGLLCYGYKAVTV